MGNRSPAAGTADPAYHSGMPKSTVRNYDAERFGTIIRRLRTERGWTLAQFAQRANMNPKYLAIMEKGGNMPSVAALFEFADVFGISAADLVREVEQDRNAARQAYAQAQAKK
jgi:XRE family transcriptional regulator, regulator of sulfur utilization